MNNACKNECTMNTQNTTLFEERYGVAFTALPGPVCVAEVDAHDWLRVAKMIHTEGGRLISLWGTDRQPLEAQIVISAAYCAPEGLLWLRLALDANDSADEDKTNSYPDLALLFPAAARMQRALFDLLGSVAAGAQDRRPWLNHGRWPRDYFPLRHEHSGQEQFDAELEPCELKPYPFVTVAGDGVHEIAVGPVHAGVIEPGHFRFSVVGEKVLRLEQRFGYPHKGIDKLFVGRSIAQGAKLAGRVCGDATVAFAWAYCMAAEAASGAMVAKRLDSLRALLLERERVANHLGDLGALGNDAGFALGLSHFTRLKEDWVRLNARLFGHRFMMDCIVPGGVSIDLDAGGSAALLTQCDKVETEVQALRQIYDGHSGLQDRFIGAGRVTPKLALKLGLCGLVGRASGQAWDVRAGRELGPYAKLGVAMATEQRGDVAARVAVRFDEIAESVRLLREIVRTLPAGASAPTETLPVASNKLGTGWVEGFRGAVFVALETDAQGAILRCHCHDPSWHNWPVLQHAIMDNIVPDFPLINKSFGLSYAGADL
jgi:Ni,Fe-hydrogenase III large subunit/Ni,Fe-hydrogenase III component G